MSVGRIELQAAVFRLAVDVREATYPFKRIHDDILHEYLISGSALAFWRTDAGPSELPMIEVPDMETLFTLWSAQKK